MFSIKAWTISQRFLHTGDCAHWDLRRPVQTYPWCNHTGSPSLLGVPFPRPSLQSCIAVPAAKQSTACPPECRCSLDTCLRGIWGTLKLWTDMGLPSSMVLGSWEEILEKNCFASKQPGAQRQELLKRELTAAAPCSPLDFSKSTQAWETCPQPINQHHPSATRNSEFCLCLVLFPPNFAAHGCTWAWFQLLCQLSSLRQAEMLQHLKIFLAF